MGSAGRRFLEDPAAMMCPRVESPYLEDLISKSGVSDADQKIEITTLSWAIGSAVLRAKSG